MLRQRTQGPIGPWLCTTRIAKQEKEKSQLENTKTRIKCKTSRPLVTVGLEQTHWSQKDMKKARDRYRLHVTHTKCTLTKHNPLSRQARKELGKEELLLDGVNAHYTCCLSSRRILSMLCSASLSPGPGNRPSQAAG